MRVLIDSHTVLWAVDDPTKIGNAAIAVLQDPANELILSAASVWELAIKVGLNRLTLSIPYKQWMTRAVADLGLSLLPITIEYADIQASLPSHHRDPFDRLLIAQGLAENIPIVTADAIFEAYGAERICD